MSKRDKRQKASEVFPGIERLKIKVVELGRDVGQGGTSEYSEQNPPGEYIDCHNELCYNGGVWMGQILRKMVRAKKTTLNETEFCQGYTGSPKGRRRYGVCSNSFRIEIHIKYKQANQ